MTKRTRLDIYLQLAALLIRNLNPNRLNYLLLASIITILVYTPNKQIKAQDFHYSQYSAAPLFLNPALAGHITGSYRFSAIYRSQWLSPTSPQLYTTPSFSADINFRRNQAKRNSLGMGLLVMNDESSGGAFNQSLATISIAYHISLDKKERHYLSLGIDGGILSKRVNLNQLVFENQLDQEGNPTQASKETFDRTSIIIPDASAGLVWTTYIKRFRLQIGGQYAHAIESNETFLGDENLVPVKMGGFAIIDIPIGKKWLLQPNGLYLLQADVMQINSGMNIAYAFLPDIQLSIGGAYRLDDAAIAKMAFDFKGLHLGFSYDLNISNLDVMTNGTGGFELTLGYTGKITRTPKPMQAPIRFF